MNEAERAHGAEPVETREIGVGGMTGDHCARRVETALREVSGVRDVRVERTAARALVTFDAAKTSVSALLDAVKRAGYEPKTTPGA